MALETSTYDNNKTMTRYSVPDEKNEESLEDVAMIDGDEKPIIKDITKASSDSSAQELIGTTSRESLAVFPLVPLKTVLWPGHLLTSLTRNRFSVTSSSVVLLRAARIQTC